MSVSYDMILAAPLFKFPYSSLAVCRSIGSVVQAPRPEPPGLRPPGFAIIARSLRFVPAECVDP